jgi:hypothetical protein
LPEAEKGVDIEVIDNTVLCFTTTESSGKNLTGKKLIKC